MALKTRDGSEAAVAQAAREQLAQLEATIARYPGSEADPYHTATASTVCVALTARDTGYDVCDAGYALSIQGTWYYGKEDKKVARKVMKAYDAHRARMKAMSVEAFRAELDRLMAPVLV